MEHHKRLKRKYCEAEPAFKTALANVNVLRCLFPSGKKKHTTHMPGLGLWKETVESWIQGRQVSQGLQPLHNAFLLIHTTCRTTQKDETRQISRGLARYSASVITKKKMKLHSYFYLNVQHKTETKLKQSDVL